jgi:peptidoglycan/xylan/chitin deacetylase (PgdA/CDA1 family)
MPLTHAVHWLLGNDEQVVWRQLKGAALEETGNAQSLGDPAEAKRIYHYETSVRALIKYAVNMALPPDAAERVIGRVTAEIGSSPVELAGQWFASAEEIVAMRNAGMIVGMHGCSHRSLQALGAEGIRQEISHASDYLDCLLGERPTWFACPFGGSGASAEAVDAMHRAMREFGIVGSVNTQKALVPSGCDPWRIPRLDAIDLPPRKQFQVPARSVA